MMAANAINGTMTIVSCSGCGTMRDTQAHPFSFDVHARAKFFMGPFSNRDSLSEARFSSDSYWIMYVLEKIRFDPGT